MLISDLAHFSPKDKIPYFVLKSDHRHRAVKIMLVWQNASKLCYFAQGGEGKPKKRVILFLFLLRMLDGEIFEQS